MRGLEFIVISSFLFCTSGILSLKVEGKMHLDPYPNLGFLLPFIAITSSQSQFQLSENRCSSQITLQLLAKEFAHVLFFSPIPYEVLPSKCRGLHASAPHSDPEFSGAVFYHHVLISLQLWKKKKKKGSMNWTLEQDCLHQNPSSTTGQL